MWMNRSIAVAVSVGRVVRRMWVPLLLLLLLSLVVHYCGSRAPVTTNHGADPIGPNRDLQGPIAPSHNTAPVAPDAGTNECPGWPHCGPDSAKDNDGGVTTAPTK